MNKSIEALSYCIHSLSERLAGFPRICMACVILNDVAAD